MSSGTGSSMSSFRCFLSDARSFAAVTAAKLRGALKKHLKELVELPPAELVERRYQKFRKMGAFVEVPS